ncbi:DUF481 domain-containing protein [bacterium]|jgi:hypothetical protein|nr:DUF481 domain-containing protein [bacterium]
MLKNCGSGIGWFLLILLMPITSVAQVNTDVFITDYKKTGYFQSADLATRIEGGNYESFHIDASYRGDYVQPEYILFTVLNYHKKYSQDVLSKEKGFAYFKYQKNIVPGLKLEVFAQREFNAFTRLLERNLLGVGLRHPVLEHECLSMFMGISLMSEHEGYSIDDDRKNYDRLRNSNYISINSKISETVLVNYTNYFQFNVSDFSDFRYLGDGQLRFLIFPRITLVLNAKIKYDAYPITKLKAYDFNFIQGISFDL